MNLQKFLNQTAVYWAKKGANVEAIDISSASISLAKKLARKHGVTKKCHFQTMTAENLKFKKEQFDYIFGNGVLHHIDLKKSAPEIHRVLKKSGKAIFIEPLAYNPVINVYRYIAKEARTPTEKPLTFQQINMLKKNFSRVRHREFEMLTLLIFLWFYLASRMNPNKLRYWRMILRTRGTTRKVLQALIFADNIFLKIPLSGYLCWNTVVIVEK